MARARGATIVSITGMHPNPLLALSDIKLYTIADEERVRASAITSRDAQLALTDMLFILLVRRQVDANDFIHRSEAAVNVLKED